MAVVFCCRCSSFTTWLSWQERHRAGKTLSSLLPVSFILPLTLSLHSPFLLSLPTFSSISPFLILFLLLPLYSLLSFSLLPPPPPYLFLPSSFLLLPFSSCLALLHTCWFVSLQEMKEAVTHFQCAAGATTYLEVSTVVMATSAP